MKNTDRWLQMILAVAVVILTVAIVWLVADGMDGKKDRAVNGMEIQAVAGTQETDSGTAMTEEKEEPVRLTQAETSKAEAGIGPGYETVEETEEDTGVTLLFAGDVLLSDHVLRAYDRAGGISGVLDEAIRSRIEEADIFMVNQEFPFSDRGTAAADKQYTFRLPPSRIHIFQEMGIDLVTLANNHILDFGTDALLDSCRTLDHGGIPYVGAGENLERAKKLETMEAGGKTIGFLGLSRVYMDGSWAASDSRPGVFSTYDTTLPVEEIRKARELCDYLVVYVHWGIERDTAPKDYQRTMGKQYIDAGADLVVGSHPHVLQGIEYYQGKPIVYSLGNFVFGSSIPKTALLKVDIEEDGTVLSLIPCTSSGGYTTMVEEEAKKAAWYREMTGLSFGITVDDDGVILAAD